MKVAITGHSTGIGKSLYEILKLSDYEVVGFSRSNGWDFCQTATRTKFFNTIVADKFDCFVNNAYPYSKVKTFEGFLQVELLNNVWLLWQNQNKQIINISSISSEVVKKFYHPYSIHKKALDDTVRQLRNISINPHIINIRPGYVDTPSVKTITNVKKCQPDEVALLIQHAMEHPLRILDLSFDAR